MVEPRCEPAGMISNIRTDIQHTSLSQTESCYHLLQNRKRAAFVSITHDNALRPDVIMGV
jgi:hypothetical protein